MVTNLLGTHTIMNNERTCVHTEHMLLIPFFGNYIINNVIAGIVASLSFLRGGTGYLTPQYITFVVLAAIAAGFFACWYFTVTPSKKNLMGGFVFGVAAFVISIATTFVSGVSGVLLQTGSWSQLINMLPNFGPFLWSWLTLVLFLYWVIPASLLGWWKGKRSSAQTAPLQ